MAPSPTIRRLLRETAELSPSSPNPTPAFHAAPVSDEDLHEWHFTLLGPPAPSPYAGGLYHGRITLPTQYPLKPPNFRFLTPSGRFEVNREICLSISGFHEETWMPAWGVRTALTALRTFMAEPGTAGQVGGLEAPEYVRKKFAAESRRWRCGGCCEGRTSEEIMKEWWEVCRGKGVSVDEEGEGVAMEVLPEGMNVEARSKGVDKGKEKDAQPQEEETQKHTQSREEAQGLVATSTSQPAPSTLSQHQPPQPQLQQQPPPPPPIHAPTPADPSPPPNAPQAHSSYFSPTPTPEQSQRAAEACLTPSDFPSQSAGNSASATAAQRAAQRPMLNLHRPPLAAASAALTEHAALERRGNHSQQVQPQQGGIGEGVLQQQQQQTTTVTIDRAIAGVFLMLVVMVLKKIFYPGGPGSMVGGLGGGAEGVDAGVGGAGGGIQREL